MLVVFHSVWVCGEGRINPSELQWIDPSGKDLNKSAKEFKLTEIVCFCNFLFCWASSYGWVIFPTAYFQTLLLHEGHVFSAIWLGSVRVHTPAQQRKRDCSSQDRLLQLQLRNKQPRAEWLSVAGVSFSCSCRVGCGSGSSPGHVSPSCWLSVLSRASLRHHLLHCHCGSTRISPNYLSLAKAGPIVMPDFMESGGMVHWWTPWQ